MQSQAITSRLVHQLVDGLRGRHAGRRRAIHLAIAAAALSLVGLGSLVSPTQASAAADLRWDRTWLDAPYVESSFGDVAADGTGATYATGVATVGGGYYDAVLAKYSPDGLLLYKRVYAGPSGKHDQPFAVGVNGRAGVVAITGRTMNAAGDTLVLTIAWTTGGKRLWTRRVPSGSFRTMGQDVAVTDTGAVVVTGQIADDLTDDDDILVVKYSRSGKQQWKKRIDGRGHGNDSGAALTVSSGDVYLAGAVIRVAPWADLLLVKFSSSGQVLWTRRWSDGAESHYEYASAVSVRKGRVVVAGGGQTATDRPAGVVVRYDTSGNLKWASIDPVANDGWSRFTEVGIDAQGNVAAGGESAPRIDDEASFFVARYLPGGTQDWVYLRGGGSDLARCTGLVVTGAGTIVATGFAESSFWAQALTVSLSPSMTELWSSFYGVVDQNNGATGIALGRGGVSVVGYGNGQGLVLRYGLAPLP